MVRGEGALRVPIEVAWPMAMVIDALFGRARSGRIALRYGGCIEPGWCEHLLRTRCDRHRLVEQSFRRQVEAQTWLEMFQDRLKRGTGEFVNPTNQSIVEREFHAGRKHTIVYIRNRIMKCRLLHSLTQTRERRYNLR